MQCAVHKRAKAHIILKTGGHLMNNFGSILPLLLILFLLGCFGNNNSSSCCDNGGLFGSGGNGCNCC